MTTDEKILVEMFERLTNPAGDIDNLAVQMFCMIVQSNTGLVPKAHELIVQKLHSNNTTEAVKAIELLEECMSKGGLEFQKKTAKFTFLNKLVALVLDKHSGPPAPIETKKRIMECLMLWTVEHQDKLKIQETYDNLKKQFDFACNASNLPALSNIRDQRPNILGSDDQLVAQLLKQGGKENHKKANLLIKHRVNQEARRTDFICHLKSELRKIETTMELLHDMLDSYNSNVESDCRDLIKDLYNTCKSHNEQMARWPDFLGEAEPEFLEDVLNTKDRLMVVIQQYKEILENEQMTIPTKLHEPLTNTDLLTDILGDTLNNISQVTSPVETSNSAKENDTVDELNEIFGSLIDNNIDNNKPHHPSELLGNLELLEPISVFGAEKKEKPIKKEEAKVKGFKELSDIDSLSEELFKQSLKEEKRSSFKKESKKLTLNDMAEKKIKTSLNVSNSSENNVDLLLKSKEKPLEVLTENNENILKNPECKENDSNVPVLLTLKPLAEIHIDLDDITPLDEGQRTILDDDIQITLNFTANRPSEHVSVIVMTATNKSKLPVKDFLFEASVKKPCKVRLLSSTDIVMAPKKPFRPSTPINQIILLLNPTQKPVDITCIIGYKLGDDIDLIKESMVAKDIPYV